MVLTESGLIIRKEKESDSKIHQIISFHRPISLTPSDMLSIGQNGVAICGSSPVDLNDDSVQEVEFDIHDSAGNRKKLKSKFGRSNVVEVSFENRDDMNEWIDAIMTQYETCLV